MDSLHEKAKIDHEIERNRVLSIGQSDAGKLSDAEQYQRMRYVLEIEGNEFVFLLRKGLSRDEAVKQARENADRMKRNWGTAHGHG